MQRQEQMRWLGSIKKVLNKINLFIDNKVGIDGLKHILISTILTTLLSLIVPCLIAALLVFLLGLIKEYCDKKLSMGFCELKDIYCNLIGIIIGII